MEPGVECINRTISLHIVDLESSDDDISEIQQESTVRHLAAGEPVMQTGQYIRSTILLLDGLLKVYREDDEGHKEDRAAGMPREG